MTTLRGVFSSAANPGPSPVAPVLDDSSVPFISSARRRGGRGLASSFRLRKVLACMPPASKSSPNRSGLLPPSYDSSPSFSVFPTTLSSDNYQSLEGAGQHTLNLRPQRLGHWAMEYEYGAVGVLPGPGGPATFYESQMPDNQQRSAQACINCRRSKTKCQNTATGTCIKCSAKGYQCIYSAKAKETRRRAPAHEHGRQLALASPKGSAVVSGEKRTSDDVSSPSEPPRKKLLVKHQSDGWPYCLSRPSEYASSSSVATSCATDPTQGSGKTMDISPRFAFDTSFSASSPSDASYQCGSPAIGGSPLNTAHGLCGELTQVVCGGSDTTFSSFHVPQTSSFMPTCNLAPVTASYEPPSYMMYH